MWLKVFVGIRGIGGVMQAVMSGWLITRYPNFVLWRPLVRHYGVHRAATISAIVGTVIATGALLVLFGQTD